MATLSGAFVSPFEWNENKTVIIKYKHGGGHIRAHPHNHELCDHKGGQTEWAKWKVHLSDSGKIAQLEHFKTGKYLQMDKFLTCINVASEGGSTSRWIVHTLGNNCVRLESERNLGYFLGVKPHDGVTIINGVALDTNSYEYQFTYLYFFIEGDKDEGYFKKPYLMKQQNTIIIKHPQNASLRTNPNDYHELDFNGQKEMHARWEAIVSVFDNTDNKTNNLNGNGTGNSSDSLLNKQNSVDSTASNKSEKINGNSEDNNNSNENGNDKDKDNNKQDSDKIDEKNITTNDNDNDDNENHNENNSKEKPDSVTTTEDTSDNTDDIKNRKDDNNSSNHNGDSKDDDSDEYDDSHEKTNIVLQFRSVKSGLFIKLDESKISMNRKGDEYTKFRVYIVEQPNIVTLESIKYPGRYIRVTTNKGVHVGKGGPHCQMTLLRME